MAWVYVKQGCNAPQPSASTFRVFILLSCSCCCIVENSKDQRGQRWNIHVVRMEFNGEMMLVVQLWPSPAPIPCTPSHMCSAQLSLCFVSGEVWSLFLTGLGREKKRTPLFSSSLKETLCLACAKCGTHKGKEGRVEGGIGVIITAKGQARHRLSGP